VRRDHPTEEVLVRLRALSSHWLVGGTVAGALALALTAPALALPDPSTTEIVSVGSDGRQGRNISGRFTAPSVSADGNVVAFDSQAGNLVIDDGNGFADVFAHDRTTGATELLSVNDAGEPGDSDSEGQAVNGDGSVVAFHSTATNLVRKDGNSAMDVFVRDRVAATTQAVSVNANGKTGNAESFGPDISPDGRYVAFVSAASNLVPGDTNRSRDVFVRDRMAGTTELVNLGVGGVLGNNFAGGAAISDDGRYVAWSTFADNVVPGDDNDSFDVFWRDRQTGETQLVSQSTDGVLGDFPSAGPAISGNGLFVAFYSEADNLVRADSNETRDIFVRDIVAGTTERVNVSSLEEQAGSQSGFSVHGGSATPAVSFDGRYVTFDTSAHLVPEDTSSHIDSYRRDRVLGETVRVSVGNQEQQGDGDSSDSAVDGSGAVVAFISLATNLVSKDTNRCFFFDAPGECPDVFVRVLSS
jgi:Tol biopolymer transport system component